MRGLLAEALDLPADYFSPFFQEPLMTLRPIHYTAEQSSPTDGVFGCGAHTGDNATLFAPSTLALHPESRLMNVASSCVESAADDR